MTNEKKKNNLFSDLREFLLDSTFVEWTLGWITGEVASRFLTSFVHDFLLPFVSGVFFGGADITEVKVEIAGQTIGIGTFLLNAIDMVIVLFVIFLVCELICHLRVKHKLEEEDSTDELIEATNKNTAMLAEIRDALVQKQ